MKDSHRYILEPYKSLQSRFVCPNCQKRAKTFTRYIDTESGEHIAPTVGRCNRVDNCGYHHTPKQYFQDNNINIKNKEFVPRFRAIAPLKPKNTNYIDSSIFKKSLEGYEKNNFVQFLIKRFGIEATTKAIERYYIGTSKHWNGSTIFWQIDINGKIRTGKIMLYNSESGKRVKEPFNHIHWVHSVLKVEKCEQCFFGLHLLKNNNKPIAVVESEKTAVVASLYFSNFIWLASCGGGSLNAEKCEILKGRNVVLFPDTSKPKEGKQSFFEIWSAKAKEFGFKVSDLLEKKATNEQKTKGLDIADYLLNFDIKDFEVKPPPAIDWKPMEDWQFSEGSREVFRIVQERKIQKVELTKQEFKNFIQTDWMNFVDEHFKLTKTA